MTYLFEKEIGDFSDRRYYNNIGFEIFFESIRQEIKYTHKYDRRHLLNIVTIFNESNYLVSSYSTFRASIEDYGDIVYIIPEDCL